MPWRVKRKLLKTLGRGKGAFPPRRRSHFVKCLKTQYLWGRGGGVRLWRLWGAVLRMLGDVGLGRKAKHRFKRNAGAPFLLLMLCVIFFFITKKKKKKKKRERVRRERVKIVLSTREGCRFHETFNIFELDASLAMMNGLLFPTAPSQQNPRRIYLALHSDVTQGIHW